MNAKKTAVQFGAGNIGRGFIAQLFHESGYEVVFVDVVPALIEMLNARREYNIHIVGPGAHGMTISNVRAVDGRDRDTVAAEVAACEIACTAVGVGALHHIAPALAAGLAQRLRQGGGPLNVLVCENLRDASGVLRSHIAAAYDEDPTPFLAQAGFVQAVVSRMVPLQSSADGRDNPLDIRVEAYKRLPIDTTAVVGVLPTIVGLEPVSNFAAHVERKLYAHNGAHAILGYLGSRHGYTYGYEALADPSIRTRIDAVMQETGAALIRKHGFDPDEHRAHVADLIERFANVALGDTCFRLARDPLRKLAPDDRLVGAARLCESQGVEPVALAEGIGLALRFGASEDRAACEMQRRIVEEGIESVMREMCGIVPDEPLGRAVLAAYERGAL